MHIPAEWETIPLGDIADFINGRGFKPHEWKTEGLPIIRIQNLNGGTEYNYYSGDYDPKILVHHGDLLFAWSGSRGTSFGPHLWLGGDALLNYHTWRVTHTPKVDKVFLFYALKSLTLEIEQAAQGAAALVHMQKAYIVDYEINLPPLPEQRKIAAILGTWDDAIDLTRRLIEALKQRKQALMQVLLTGEVRFPGFDEDWEEKTLEDICEIKGGKRLPLGSSLTTQDTGFPYLRISDMNEDGISTTNIQFVPQDIAPLIQAYRIFSDDLYISVAGTIGLVGEIPEILAGANLTENADRLTNIQINRRYLLNVLRSKIIQQQIWQTVTLNAQPKLALTRIREFYLPVPSSDEQAKLTEVLDTSIDEIRLLTIYHDILQTQKRGLMQKLLTGQVRVQVEGE